MRSDIRNIGLIFLEAEDLPGVGASSRNTVNLRQASAGNRCRVAATRGVGGHLRNAVVGVEVFGLACRAGSDVGRRAGGGRREEGCGRCCRYRQRETSGEYEPTGTLLKSGHFQAFSRRDERHLSGSRYQRHASGEPWKSAVKLRAGRQGGVRRDVGDLVFGEADAFAGIAAGAWHAGHLRNAVGVAGSGIADATRLIGR
jgi:hypothetical protein